MNARQTDFQKISKFSYTFFRIFTFKSCLLNYDVSNNSDWKFDQIKTRIWLHDLIGFPNPTFPFEQASFRTWSNPEVAGNDRNLSKLIVFKGLKSRSRRGDAEKGRAMAANT